MNFRPLKLLIGVLIASNIVLGVLSVYLLLALDHDYTLLIDRSVPVINQLRAMNKTGAAGYRLLIWSTVTTEPAARLDSFNRAREVLRRGKLIRSQVMAANLFKDRMSFAAHLRMDGAAYDKAMEELLNFLVTASPSGGAVQVRLEQARPAYRNYIASIEQAANFVELRSQAMSDELSDRVHRRSALILSIAGWPVLAGGVVILLTSAVVIGTLLVFRHAEAGSGA